MAVYEYRCRTCDDLFELRRPMSESDAPAECPHGHADTVRLLSVFASAGARDAPARDCLPADAVRPAPASPIGEMTDAALVPHSVRLYLVSFLIVGMAMSVLGPALTDLRERSGADIGDIGILFVGQSLGYIVGSFTGGRLFDRFNSHRVFAGSLVLLGIGLALVPAFDALTGLFVDVRRDRLRRLDLRSGWQHVADVAARRRVWTSDEPAPPVLRTRRADVAVGRPHRPRRRDAGRPPSSARCWRCGRCECRRRRGRRTPREEHTDTTLSILLLLFLFFFLYVGLEVGFAGWIKTYGEEIGFTELTATWLTTVFWLGFTGGRLLASAIANRVRPDTILSVACVGVDRGGGGDDRAEVATRPSSGRARR